MAEIVTLYRPVGPEELELIRQSGWRRFPPRLPGQPIFYPVLQEDYAARIARDWNVRESGAGFVTRFSVSADYLSRFQAHEVGGRGCREYWIPAESLSEFNNHIEGRIEVVAEFHGRREDSAVANSGWVKVYDLAEDEETIHLVQQATLNTEDFGLVPEVALFGSDEWWRAIQDGRIPRHEVHGVISRVFMSGHGDWPEFELEEASGEKSRWTRLGPAEHYRVGNEVRLEYVLQKARKHWLGSREQKQVLRVLVRPLAPVPTAPPAPVHSAKV